MSMQATVAPGLGQLQRGLPPCPARSGMKPAPDTTARFPVRPRSIIDCPLLICHARAVAANDADPMMLQKIDTVMCAARAIGRSSIRILCARGVQCRTLRIDDLEAIGHGIERPEQVLVARDGAVYASDKASAVARVLCRTGCTGWGRRAASRTGSLSRGAGHFLIANFGLGALQDLDPSTGAIRVLVRDRIGDRSLQWINYVLVDSSGALWVSVCSSNPDLRHTIAHGTPDGYIFRMDRPDSLPEVVADGVNFPNCMALDRDEEYLYVVRTLKADVVRFAATGAPGSVPRNSSARRWAGAVMTNTASTPTALIADRAVTRRWGMADGCAFDAEGNLWVTLARANRIVGGDAGPAGRHDRRRSDGVLLSGPTSVAWGGSDMRDVYIGSLEAPYILQGRSNAGRNADGAPEMTVGEVCRRSRSNDTRCRATGGTKWWRMPKSMLSRNDVFGCAGDVAGGPEIRARTPVPGRNDRGTVLGRDPRCQPGERSTVGVRRRDGRRRCEPRWAGWWRPRPTCTPPRSLRPTTRACDVRRSRPSTSCGTSGRPR